jgi:hypothetical protein
MTGHTAQRGCLVMAVGDSEVTSVSRKGKARSRLHLRLPPPAPRSWLLP